MTEKKIHPIPQQKCPHKSFGHFELDLKPPKRLIRFVNFPLPKPQLKVSVSVSSCCCTISCTFPVIIIAREEIAKTMHNFPLETLQRTSASIGRIWKDTANDFPK